MEDPSFLEHEDEPFNEHMREGKLPVKYLGLPLITTRLKSTDCTPLITRLTNRVQSWKGCFLSYAGRVQLNKSVLNSLSVYWFSSFIIPLKTIEEVNRICRNFLWNGTDCSFSHSIIGWEQICYPYDEGGLEISDLARVNQAATMKHLWHIVSDKDSLWVKWVKKNLIRGRNFWHIKIPSDCSWVWRNILKLRKDASFFAMHLIGEGNETSFWMDPWHPVGILKEYFPQERRYRSTCNMNAKVSELIENGEWRVPNYIHLPGIITEMLEDVKVAEGHDKIVWTPTLSGDYKMKETYESVRDTKVPVEWHNIVWFTHRIPKHSFITWMALTEGMKTRQKLKEWKTVTDETCVLCCRETENENHLFFDCVYGQYVWAELLTQGGYARTRPGTWKEEIQWVVKATAGRGLKQDALRLLFTGYHYWVWRERNNRIFNNTWLIAAQVVKLVIKDVRTKLISINLQMEGGPDRERFMNLWNIEVQEKKIRYVRCKWERAMTGIYNLNSDGTLKNSEGGWGAVIRNDQGEVISAAHGSSEYKNIALIELQGVQQGIKLAKEKGLRRLKVQTDSQNVVSFFNKSEYPWEATHMMRNIRKMITELEQFSIIHVFRECNRLADAISANIPAGRYIVLIPSSFVEDVKKIVYEDAIGKE